jgi:hypothetical protein
MKPAEYLFSMKNSVSSSRDMEARAAVSKCPSCLQKCFKSLSSDIERSIPLQGRKKISWFYRLDLVCPYRGVPRTWNQILTKLLNQFVGTPDEFIALKSAA